MKTQTCKPSTFSVLFPLNTASIIKTGQFIKLPAKEQRAITYRNNHNQELVFRHIPLKLVHSPSSDLLCWHRLQSVPCAFILLIPWANLHSPGFLLLCLLPVTATPDSLFQERPTQSTQYTEFTWTTPSTFVSAITNFSCKSLVHVSTLLRLPGNKMTVLWVCSEQQDCAHRDSYVFPKTVHAGPMETLALVLQRYPEIRHR